MSPAVVISCLVITLGLHLNSVTGLKCHCDFCSRTNNTCETDGFCLSITWLQRETGIVHHAFRCLDRKMYFPRVYPAHCSLSTVGTIAVSSACCSRDMCNMQLTPKLEVVTRGPDFKWYLPRNRSHHAKVNGTRQKPLLGDAPALNFINSTEQLDE